MNNTMPALCLDRYSRQRMNSILRVKTEKAFKDPEVKAAFEKWMTEREEARNADKQ